VITSQQYDELIAEFSDLIGPDAVLQKEVYAHFGLLFFKFALVEHSLINTLTFHHVGTEVAGKRIRTKSDWEQAHDRGFDEARQKTFGNLVRAIISISEFRQFADELSAAKKQRDYFAHHFFREESGVCREDEGCWQVLWAIKQIRMQVVDLDQKLSLPTQQMCKRLGVPWPSAEVLQRSEAELLEEDQARLNTGDPFHWSKMTS
jgi:hypothetical protein